MKVVKAKKKRTSFSTFDRDMLAIWNEFLDLHKEFDAMRNIQNLSQEQWNKAGDLVIQIQEKFREEFHPYANMVINRYQFCVNAMNSFQGFLDELKKMGAREVEKESGLIH